MEILPFIFISTDKIVELKVGDGSFVKHLFLNINYSKIYIGISCISFTAVFVGAGDALVGYELALCTL